MNEQTNQTEQDKQLNNTQHIEQEQPPVNTNMKWYIVKTKVGKEEKVRDVLKRRIDVEGFNKGIGRVLVPIKKVVQMRTGKKITQEQKLYPGYVFIEMSYSYDAPESWYFIRSTPGIGAFLGVDEPTPLSEKEVDEIINSQFVSEEAKVDIGLKKGDIVRIKEGPFENFEGIVENINEEKGTVKLIVNIFGRATEVELEHWQIEVG